ncbi:MAG: trypsin-like peptidase domain-containing protein, partial [Myxococcota bacterium]
FDAEVVGADAKNDVAVLVVKTEEDLPWLAPGTSRDLMVGEPLIAIGNPFGLSHSVTTGVLSAIHRSLRTETYTFHGFLQTDASINPGNSGGPLLNAHGRLVGVNTAVFHPAQSQGIGFAIPIDTAKRIMRELIEHGEVSPVWLGLDFQDLSPSLIEALGLPEQARGALINRVRPESPGSRAQLQRMDVVTHFDGQTLDSAQSFFERLESVTNNQKVELTLQRDGKRKTAVVHAEEVPSIVIDALLAELTGLQVTEQNGGGFRIQSVRRGSGASRVGLTDGDLLLALDERALSDREALRRATLGIRGRSQAMILVQRGAGRYHLALPLR